MPSAESAAEPRAPAWKRLGLKLKQPGDSAGAAPAPGAGTPVVGHPGGSTGHKRRFEAPQSTGEASPLKKSRKEGHAASSPAAATNTRTPSALSTPQNGSSSKSTKPKKTVKFGDTPTKSDVGSTPNKNQPAKKSKTKAAAPAKQPASTDVTPALEYLRQWKTSRESWKFNKNLQSTLIKHIFEPKVIPADVADIFYDYILDLKGFVRTRLHQTAMEIQMEDAAAGTSGFASDLMDLDDKQETYDAILADVLRRRRQNGPKRKFFNEAQYVADSRDADVVICRLVKRMRAQMVLEELADAGEMTDTTTASSTSTRTVEAVDKNAKQDADAKRPDGPQGRRRRKLRVNMEDSSSSESESDSDSGTSSSGSDSSSDESDSEEELQEAPAAGYDTSSSSASSSDEDDDDSDDESDDEEED